MSDPKRIFRPMLALGSVAVVLMAAAPAHAASQMGACSNKPMASQSEKKTHNVSHGGGQGAHIKPCRKPAKVLFGHSTSNEPTKTHNTSHGGGMAHHTSNQTPG